MTAAIELKDVAKVYTSGRKRVEALRGVSMTVRPGQVFGLLGPNGAGKSTLVKILMTVIRPTRAEGSVLGRRLGDREALARVGYLPEHHKFPDYLTARQVMHHFGAMSGVGRADRNKRCGELLELVGIGGWTKDKVGTFSKGMRQRLGIAQALMNDPELVLLDEPTDGVDPVGRREIRGVVEELRTRGKAVLLNSHLLSELELVCDRVAILVKGQVAQEGELDELGAEERRYEIQLAEPPPPGVLDRFEGVTVEGPVLRSPETEPAAVQPLLAALVGARATIVSVRPVRPTLEDLFMRAVTDPETGRAFAPGAERGAGR